MSVEKPVSDTSSVDLSQVSMAFADSSVAANFARRAGLPASVKVNTFSPALILGDDDSFAPADSNWSDQIGEELRRDTLRLCRDIHDKLLAIEEFEEAAVALSQIGILFPSLVRVAMAIGPDAYECDVAVILTDPEHSKDAGAINIPWNKFLQDNPKLILASAAANEAEAPFHRERAETVGFLDRQSLGGWDKIGFQIIQKLWNFLPFSSPRGTFLTLRENYLLRETALHLTYRGFGLHSLTPPPVTQTALETGAAERLRHALSEVLESYLETRVSDAAKPILRSIFEEQCGTALARFYAGKEYWQRTLNGLARKRTKAVLTNMLMTPESAALHTVCQSRGIPVASFQHGIAREISQYNFIIQAYFEGNTSDYFYACNPASARVSEASFFNRCKAVAVGLPGRNLKSGTYRRADPSAPPMLYVSTQLYAVSTNMTVVRGCTDTELAKSELDLINNVFDRIPHDILFKPYPECRYLDPDPVIERASEVSNLTIYADGDDVGFLFADCRVIVTSRATSTLGACVSSGKPVVFINYSRQMPLRQEARDAMEDAFFVFDADSPDHHKRLADFLSQPLAEIELQWQEKADARARTINEFFAYKGKGAGQRAARHLISTAI
jgi:hypothetical protein